MNYSINTATYDNIYDNNKQSSARLQNKRTNGSKEKTSLFNNNMQKKKKINKSEQKDKQVLKNKTYESHAKVISKDIKPSNFSRVILTENQVDITGILQNEDSNDNKVSFLKSPQKRNHGQTMGKDGEVKRRRQNASCA